MNLDTQTTVALVGFVSVLTQAVVALILKRGQKKNYAKLNTVETSVNGKMEQLLEMTERRGVARGVAKRSQTLLDAFPFAAIEVGAANHTILRVNERAVLVFGYAKEEMVGALVDMLVPSEYMEKHRGQMEEYVASPETVRPMGVGRALMARRKGGGLIPVEIWLSPLEGVDSPSVLTVVRRLPEPLPIKSDGP